MLTPIDFQQNPQLKNCSARPSQHSNIFLRKKLESCSNLFVKSLNQHTGSVNAIEFDKKNDFLASGGDDKSIRLWSIERDILAEDSVGQSPSGRMAERHMSNIFALQFDCLSGTIVSGGNDGIIFLHSVGTGQLIRGMVRTQPVLSLSCHPTNPSLLSAAFNDGRIIQYDTRAAERPPAVSLLTGCGLASCVAYHPTQDHLLLTATAQNGVCLIDTRRPTRNYCSVEPPSSSTGDGSSLNAVLSSIGDLVLVVGRQRCPALYSLSADNSSAHRLAVFDDACYYSSCTSKSCCFAGPDDSFVATGSDSCQAFLWRRPSCSTSCEVAVSRASLTLTGHQSVVNQVRYSPRFCLLATSGVDLSVKIWSPFTAGPGFATLVDENSQGSSAGVRQVHTYDEFLRGGVRTSPGHQLAKERQLAAYFDSLLQRDVCSSAAKNSSTSASSSDSSSDDESSRASRRPQTRRQLTSSRLDRIRPHLPPRWAEVSESDDSSSELSSDNDIGKSRNAPNADENFDRCLHSYSKRRRGIVEKPTQQRKRRHGPCGCRVRQFRLAGASNGPGSIDRDLVMSRLRQLLGEAQQRLGRADALAAANVSYSNSSMMLASNPLLSLRPASMQQLISVARLLHHRGPMPAKSPPPGQLLLPGSTDLLATVTDLRTFPCLSWRCHRRFIVRTVSTFAFLLYADCSALTAALSPRPPPPPPPPPPNLPSPMSSSSSSSSSGSSTDSEEEAGRDRGNDMTVARLLQMPLVFFSEDEDDDVDESSSTSTSESSDV